MALYGAMSTPRLQRPLAIASLLYAAMLWGLVWYPYRLLGEAGVGGIASSFFSYAVPLLLMGWLHAREVRAARARWTWLAALGLAAGWTNLAYVLAVLQGESRLRALRKWRGMTQDELAGRTGLTQGFLSDLESRRRAASAETVDRLALALDVPKTWIDG